jgi:hypothetical protein
MAGSPDKDLTRDPRVGSRVSLVNRWQQAGFPDLGVRASDATGNSLSSDLVEPTKSNKLTIICTANSEEDWTDGTIVV